MGAARVVAAGRNPAALRSVAAAAGARVATVALSGDVATDAEAIRAASGGGAHIAFDMVGTPAIPDRRSRRSRVLRRGGRLVAMGSMTVDLPVP